LLNLQINAIERTQPAVLLGDLFNFDRGLHCPV